jgi:hypothetical protein
MDEALKGSDYHQSIPGRSFRLEKGPAKQPAGRLILRLSLVHGTKGTFLLSLVVVGRAELGS